MLSAGGDVGSAGDAAVKKMDCAANEVASDLERPRPDIVQKKHDWDARRAEGQADRLEWEASLGSTMPLPR